MLLENQPIHYNLIDSAIKHYKSLGYEYIEVPWVIGKEAHDITGKDYKKTESYLGIHVASAEQSLLELILNNKITPGKYVAVSPCFREDEPSEFYSKWFMKVELMNYIGKKKGEKEQVREVIEDAKKFFSMYSNNLIEVKTEEGIDLKIEGIEIGSYGLRKYKEFSWIYGTGIAEPRFSYLLLKNKKGYHNNIIPKGKYGEISKIIEEYLEFIDSYERDIKIMSLIELSDLIGSIEGFLNREYENRIEISDLLKMAKLNEKVFKEGVRK